MNPPSLVIVLPSPEPDPPDETDRASEGWEDAEEEVERAGGEPEPFDDVDGEEVDDPALVGFSAAPDTLAAFVFFSGLSVAPSPISERAFSGA